MWFCPNNKCHFSRGRRPLGKLPSPPEKLEVLVGTNLSIAEMDYLTQMGLRWTGQAVVPNANPNAVGLRINVDLFYEKINLEDPIFRLPSRNGRNSRQRFTQTSSHFTRIQSAETQRMSVIMEKDITRGNGWGKQILVQNHEGDISTSQYWVQVCIFPCCSCEDFWRRHSHSKPYLPCKHIFWVYKNIFHLDLHNSTLVNQPILTVREVQLILER